LRTFVAIDFSPEIIRKINDVINYFKTQTPEKALKWVAPENLHLTVKFLGDVPDNKIEQVKMLINQALENVKSFEIGVEKLGMYPNPGSPRVVWLGITGGEPLKEIHKKLESQLQEAEIEPEKRSFSPHLTIARVRRNADKQTVKEIGEALSKFKVDSLGKCLINHVVLYKSELTPKGPIYTPLLSSPLNKV
jgi:2'-5' RNA ligase